MVLLGRGFIRKRENTKGKVFEKKNNVVLKDVVSQEIGPIFVVAVLLCFCFVLVFAMGGVV